MKNAHLIVAIVIAELCFQTACIPEVEKPKGTSNQQIPQDNPPHSADIQSAIRPNLLLVTIDTLRADRLPSYGYKKGKTPHLNALSTHSVVFDKVAAHTPITLPSHASILTGLYPPQHGVRSNGRFYAHEKLTTLAEVLKEEGYQTGAFVSAFVLDSRFGLNQGFDHYDDDLVDGRRRFSKFSVKDRRAENTVSRVLSWLDRKEEKLHTELKPFFIWTHLYDPHYAYDPPEPFRSDNADLHDGEIAYTDAHIGRLLDSLKQRGLYDNTVVVITADHGESFGEHGETTHSVFVYEATQWVPLFIKPKTSLKQGLRVGGIVRHIDIFPTALDLLGIEDAAGKLPASILGTSLARCMKEGGRSPVSESYAEAYLPLERFGWSPSFAWRDNDFKYIDSPAAELYDLKTDPAEKANIFEKGSDEVKKYRQKYEELRARLKPVVETDHAQKAMDAETVHKLKALGYMSESEPIAREQGKDSKEMVHLHEARERIHELMEREQYQQAIKSLVSVIRKDPGNHSFQEDLAAVYAELGQWKNAERAYIKARDLSPNTATSYQGLAKVYFKGTKEFELAKKAIDAASLVEPQNPAIWVLRGDFLHAVGKMGKAARAYEKAVDEGSQNGSLFVGYASALTNLGQTVKARAMVEKSLAIDDENPIAHYNSGVILEKLKLFEEAEKSYQSAIHFGPENILAYENLSKMLQKQGRSQHAVQVLLRGLKTDPIAKNLLFSLGSLYLKENQPDKALPVLEKLVSLEPGFAGGRTNLGFAYEQLDRLSEAFKQYKALTEIYPKTKLGFADAHLRLARIRAIQGKNKEAARFLKTALSHGGEPIVKAAKAYPVLKDLL